MPKGKYKRKKKKSIKLNEALGNKVIENLDKGIEFVNQTPVEPLRASKISYVFVSGHKVLLRNLTDERLNDEYEQVRNRVFEMRRQLDLLESQQFNMSMEQNFRGLK